MPSDPFLATLAVNIIGDIVTAAVVGVGKVVGIKVWGRADETTRLFYLLEAAFGEHLPSITQPELEATWRTDAAFMDVYNELSAGADPEEQHPALVAAIEPLVGPTANATAAEVADRIARVLPYLMVEAKQGSERVLIELRRMWNVVETQHTETTGKLDELLSLANRRATSEVIFAADWPPAAERALRRAQDADAEGLAVLNRALESKDAATELPALLRARPAWMTSLRAQTWELLAIRCQDVGLWEEAKQAWLQAREQPGADYVRCTVRAAEAASQLEDDDAARDLLDAARDTNPNHPLVAFHDALGLEDGEQALAVLEAITTGDPEIRGTVLIAKAFVHLSLGDAATARAQLDAAKDEGAVSMLGYRVTDKTVAAQEALEEWHPSAGDISELVAECLALESELLRRRQLATAAQMRSQASAFHAFVGDFGLARQTLIDAVATYQVDSAEPRLTLAMAAAHLDLDEVIEAMLRPEDAGRLRHRYLSALVKTRGDETAAQEAAAELDALITEPNKQIRALAAIRRLTLAGRAPDVGWSEEAEAIVRERQVSPAVVFKALWLERTDRRDDAERELLAYSDEGWALVELMHIAERAEDWPRAAERAELALQHDIDWHAQLTAAEALRLGDKTEAALAKYRELAQDDDAPDLVRAAAYRRLTQAAFANSDHRSSCALAQAWLDIDPDDGDAGWALVLSWVYLGQDQKALDVMRDSGLHPRQPAEFRIASQMLIARADPVEALRTIVGYADEQSVPSEELEAFIISAALRTGQHLPADLRERVAVERFTQMFPNSERLRAYSMEELREYMEQGLANRVQHIQAVESQLYEGGVPTATLAAITNNDLGALWMRMSWGRGMPMGYGSVDLDELERADARAAIGSPVIWDPTSVFIFGHVLSDLADRIRTLFPGSRLTQSGLLDIVEGSRAVSADAPPEEPRQEFGYDTVAGAPTMTTWDPEVQAAYTKRAADALELAQKLDAVADVDADAPQPEDSERDAVDTSGFRAFVATFSAARRLRLPIYSDDREVRRLARKAGLKAFGTLTLLDALTDAGHITTEEQTGARRRLLRHRALGVNLAPHDIIAFGRETDWKLSFELAFAMLDPGPWRADTAVTFLAWLDALRDVRREAPDEFAWWVARFLDAIHRTRPELSVARQAQHLITTSMVSTDADVAEFVRDLIRAFAKIQPYCTESLAGAPTLGLLALAQNLSSDTYTGAPVSAGALLFRAWSMLPLDYQVQTVGLFL
jgi:tetratricopeptide (TPR) repeat protein